MARALPTLLFIVGLLIAQTAFASPFSLDTKKQYKDLPEITGFQYWFGDVNYGFAVYIGTRDISGYESELQLHFSGKLLTKATLILGPAGISSLSCIADYKKVVKLLNEKYGHYRYQNVVKDPMFDELIATSVCAPVLNELYTIYTFWKTKKCDIVSTLLGDDDGFYIEVDYVFRKAPNRELKELRKAL